MVRRFRPTDRILIDWGDDGYEHPFADVTENLQSYDIRYGADVVKNPKEIVITKAEGRLVLDNSTFRYSYGSFTNDDIDEVALAASSFM